jgi:transcriptional regulator with XRE-family HTH domain
VASATATDTKPEGIDEPAPDSLRRCPEHRRRREACARSLELARIAQGLSQQRAADSARVSRSLWQKYESGEHALDPAAVECSPALARTFYALRLAAIDSAPLGPPIEASLPVLVQIVGEIGSILADGQITFDEVERTHQAGAALRDIGQRLILAAQKTYDRERGR